MSSSRASSRLSSLLALVVAVGAAGGGAVADPGGTAAAAEPEAAAERSPFDRLVAALVPSTASPSVTGSVETEAASPVVAARLPACRMRNQPTRHSRVRDWRITLLDTNLRLPQDYEPWDLVNVSRAGIRGVGKIRKLMIADLRALAEAAARAGKPLAVRSAFRSWATQKAIYDREVRRVGRRLARTFVARPGHSEHQLGTTIDFTAASGGALSQRFGRTPAGRWIAKHGWKYGFILSYPKGKKRASCYGYEPWHWRYVGREMARAIHESGQVPRRYLWENHESIP